MYRNGQKVRTHFLQSSKNTLPRLYLKIFRFLVCYFAENVCALFDHYGNAQSYYTILDRPSLLPRSLVPRELLVIDSIRWGSFQHWMGLLRILWIMYFHSRMSMMVGHWPNQSLHPNRNRCHLKFYTALFLMIKDM